MSITKLSEDLVERAAARMLSLAKVRWPSFTEKQLQEAIAVPKTYLITHLNIAPNPLKDDLSNFDHLVEGAFETATHNGHYFEGLWVEHDGRFAHIRQGPSYTDRLKSWGKLSATKFQEGSSSNQEDDRPNGFSFAEHCLFTELLSVGLSAATDVPRGNYGDDVAFALAVADQAIVGTLDALEKSCDVQVKLSNNAGGNYTKHLTQLSNTYWTAVNS